MTRMRLFSLLLLPFLVFPLSVQAVPPAAPAGLPEQSYGPPAAADSTTDGNGNENMDLLDLYIAEDATRYYFAFTIDDDLSLTDWGKYVIYLDTDGLPGSGATGDAWLRNVVVDDPHRPEYGIYTWVDNPPYGPEDTQFWYWDGSAWVQDGTADAATLTTGETSRIEWQIAKSRLGNPALLWVEVWSTGELGTPNAQDTINDPPEDWNAWDWETTAHLACSTRYPGVRLGITFPPDGHYFALPYLDLTGVVSPSVGVTVAVNLNGTAFFTPTVAAGGAFTQPLTLERGANTITVTAHSAEDDTTVIRHVSFGAAQDDDVFWDGLYHNSRNSLYRSPTGAVPAGTPVRLRFRSYANDLTSVEVRVWDDRQDTATLYPMEIVSSDPAYDYWEGTLSTSEPTVLWYRFIVTDGSDTDYYEDDQIVDDLYRGYNEGGPGKPYDTSPDLSFQITVYDPALQTPDWVKNAVVYQVFPDRFRDGDPANNVISGTHFVYGNPNGGITYTTWNSEVIDPRDPGSPYYWRWSEDFYGGDLQGIADRLDDLQAIGFTALYLNPIFLSPSNHKYDTTDYTQVDPHLGGNGALAALLAAAQARGMRVVLDGVFNHSSSDSIYFDKYGRYPTAGAYESQSSPYYDWYTFYDWPDDYKSWWGFDTLPVLDSSNPEVRSYVYGDADAIGRRWVISGTAGWRLDVGGDIDPGLTRDPTNDYWENFRQAVKGADPEAVIIGEEWGDASPWLLGGEWDAVMNYRFRSALLSFLRDRHYEDNDNNPASYGGVLDPITPSQLDAWLRGIQEDYPPEAWLAMMNLLGSHDTNRLRFVLSKNQKGDDDQHLPYNPATDLSPEEVDPYQNLLALLQFTLPGAPTVYYGDEVGVDAPGRWYNEKWEDDPYNRVPFPWADTPGHYARRPQIAARYALLAQARADHPALRIGSFDTLLTDDQAMLYVYGRKWISGTTDLAVVVVNRDALGHSVSLDVAGYIGEGAVLSDLLHAGRTYTVSGGLLLLPEVAAMDGALLVQVGGDTMPPDPPTNLTAQEGEGWVALTWEAVPDAVGYNLYRSLFSGGGYSRILTGSAALAYTDTDVVNGTWYYYVATAVDAAGNESGYSNEAAALPHYRIDWANLQWPPEITHTIGLTPTPPIYGQVWIEGITEQPGPTPGLRAQVGLGPAGTPPISWTWWVEASFNMDVGNNDEFMGSLLPEYLGEYHYLYRYSTTDGREWTYADRSGTISPTGVVSPGLLHVLPSGDLTPPAVPQNLRVTHWGLDHISLAWDPVGDVDLYAYDLYRWGEGETISDALRIGRVLAPTVLYTDTTVQSRRTYTYTVRSLDTSFNRSALAEPVSATTEQRMVTLTLLVEVPAFTPPEDTVYVAGDNADVFGAVWDPAFLPLTQTGATHWRVVLRAPDGAALQYKYTRGSWERVEKWGWLVGYANRELTVTYGAGGAMTVSDVIYNWRDPLVVSVYPPGGATTFDPNDPITATFSRGLDPSTVNTATVLVNGGAVTGVVTYVSPTVRFQPGAPLDPQRYYQVELGTGIREESEGIPLQRTYPWAFGRPPVLYRIHLPLVLRGYSGGQR